MNLIYRSSANEPGSQITEKELGIGGLFFRAHDPAGAAWYRDHPGITVTPSNYEQLR
ncbi:MAG TPA: hypothetical protein VK473_08565 [Terriglobales bacterium]|nr:hypothetical protein [Terriglobales bacterium]